MSGDQARRSERAVLAVGVSSPRHSPPARTRSSSPTRPDWTARSTCRACGWPSRFLGCELFALRVERTHGESVRLHARRRSRWPSGLVYAEPGAVVAARVWRSSWSCSSCASAAPIRGVLRGHRPRRTVRGGTRRLPARARRRRPGRRPGRLRAARRAGGLVPRRGAAALAVAVAVASRSLARPPRRGRHRPHGCCGRHAQLGHRHRVGERAVGPPARPAAAHRDRCRLPGLQPHLPGARPPATRASRRTTSSCRRSCARRTWPRSPPPCWRRPASCCGPTTRCCCCGRPVDGRARPPAAPRRQRRARGGRGVARPSTSPTSVRSCPGRLAPCPPRRQIAAVAAGA